MVSLDVNVDLYFPQKVGIRDQIIASPNKPSSLVHEIQLKKS